MTSIISQEQEKSIAKLQTEKDRIDRENRQKQQKIKDLESEVQKLRKDVEKERNAKKNELDRLKQQLQGETILKNMIRVYTTNILYKYRIKIKSVSSTHNLHLFMFQAF